MAPRPKIPTRSYTWEGSFTLWGVNIRNGMLNSYCVTSVIALDVIILGIKSSVPILTIFFRQFGTRLMYVVE